MSDLTDALGNVRMLGAGAGNRILRQEKQSCAPELPTLSRQIQQAEFLLLSLCHPTVHNCAASLSLYVATV